jgi:uncharacterized lipoprotein NlpE involved in copper resistance
MEDSTKYSVGIWAVLLFLSIMGCTNDKNGAAVTGDANVGGAGSGAGGAQAGLQARSGASGQEDEIAA